MHWRVVLNFSKAPKKVHVGGETLRLNTRLRETQNLLRSAFDVPGRAGVGWGESGGGLTLLCIEIRSLYT